MARAITSFPVPVSPWIKTEESTGAILSTSVSNARNFGLEPIKLKVVTEFSLVNADQFRVSADQSQNVLAAIVLSRDPLPYVRQAVHERDVSRLTSGEEDDPVFAGKSDVFQVDDNPPAFWFRSD
jgi:hypothetical protein